MSHWRAVREVAAWEFRRFLRVRELLTTIVVVAVMAGPLPAAIGYMARRDAESAVTLAVPPGAGLAEASRFRFVELPPDEAASALERGEVDGILDLTDPAAPSLVVPRDPRWADALAAALGQRALQARLAEVGVTPDELSALGAPVPLEVNVTGSSRSSGVWPLVVISGFMLTLVSSGTALLFTAITGEKTQRVTELVLSAISPQAWIDGKVLGTGLSVLVNVLAFGLGIGLALLVPPLVRREPLPALPALAGDPGVVVVSLAFAAAGAALYFLLFAAVAATIDDPATSQRSGVLTLPALFVGLGFLGLVIDPGNGVYRFLSYLPLSSPSAMPVRYLAGDAGALEVLLSLALVTATAVASRRAAGRVFALAILMTGKEPTWREVWRWLRRA